MVYRNLRTRNYVKISQFLQAPAFFELLDIFSKQMILNKNS